MISARIGCLPLSHQGFLSQIPYLQLILSAADRGFVVCTFPPHNSAGLHSMTCWGKHSKEPVWLCLYVWFLYTVCCRLSPGVQLFYMLHGLLCAELCLAGKESSEEMHGLSYSGKWGRVPKLNSYSKRTYFYISTFNFLYSHTVLIFSLTYASIQKKVNFLIVHRVSCQER